MKRSCVSVLALSFVALFHSLASAGSYPSAEILLSGDEYSDLSLIAELPVRHDGPGWVMSSGTVWTAWSQDQDWIEFTVSLTTGNWNIGLNVINHSVDGVGLGEDASWYPQFEIKMEIIDLLSGHLVIPASDRVENNGFLNIDLPEGEYTFRFTWLNDKYESSKALDANLQINSVFFDRVADYGSSVKDLNANGLPDDQEVGGLIDLNHDGVNDLLQEKMKCVQSNPGIEPLCMQTNTSNMSLVSLKYIGAELVLTPFQILEEMPFGLLAFVVHIESNNGESSMEAFFSETIPQGSQIFLYNPYDGLLEQANDVILGADQQSIAFSLDKALLQTEEAMEEKRVFVYAGIKTPEQSDGNSTTGAIDVEDGDAGGSCFIHTIFGK